MSLTLLVRDRDSVAIVRWFLESKGLVLFAGGPITQMRWEEFRATGYEWLHRHFVDYAKTRVPEDKIIKVFQTVRRTEL